MDVGERKSQNNHNRPTAPDQLTNGAAEKVDLIAEWKIVTTQWRELLAACRKKTSEVSATPLAA